MPPLPSEAEPRPPEDFASVLATEVPLLLVGGQAVNVWAVYYESRTAALAPFVSRDVDVLGDRDTLAALGKLAGAKPQYFALRPPTNEIGVVIAKDRSGRPLLIEVLRFVHGVTNEELREPAYTVALGETHVQVPSPIALLQAKIANVADLAQAGRQDSRHVLILAQVLPAYLDDLHAAVGARRLEERQLIELLERLLSVVTASKAKAVLKKLSIDVSQLFAGLDGKNAPKLRSFLEKRLPRLTRSSSSSA
jgi:hypothetical protein